MKKGKQMENGQTKMEPEPQKSCGSEVEKLVMELKQQNLTDEQIAEALEKMAKEGKLSAEDLASAMDCLKRLSGEEKESAEKMFGMKFVE